MQIRLHKGQSEVFEDIFVNDREENVFSICTSRGWGKSRLLATIALQGIKELLDMPRTVANKNVILVGPTQTQTTSIFLPIFEEYGLMGRCLKYNISTSTFFFGKNVTFRLISYEAIARLRGLGIYLFLGDEVASWHNASYSIESIVHPAQSTRWPGMYKRVLASTPLGYNDFYDIHNDSKTRQYVFPYQEAPYLDPVEVEFARQTTDPINFAREYLAEFSESGLSVFSSFSRARNVKSLPALASNETLHIGLDFNLGIMAGVICALRGTELHCLAETMGATNTSSWCEDVLSRYGRERKIIVYPDPTGEARKTSSPIGQTDISILRDYGFDVITPGQGNIRVVDSANVVNGLLYSASGDTKLFFDSVGCARFTIPSVERCVWKEGTDKMMVDKRRGDEHWSEALRYIVYSLFQNKARLASRRPNNQRF